MRRRLPISILFPTRRSSDLVSRWIPYRIGVGVGIRGHAERTQGLRQRAKEAEAARDARIRSWRCARNVPPRRAREEIPKGGWPEATGASRVPGVVVPATSNDPAVVRFARTGVGGVVSTAYDEQRSDQQNCGGKSQHGPLPSHEGGSQNRLAVEPHAKRPRRSLV